MRALKQLVTAILLSGAGPLSAEPAMILDARGPSALQFPRGTMLDNAFSAILQPRDRLIVVDGKGTRVFSGPGPVAIDREATDTPSRWDDIRTMVVRSRDHMKRRGRMKTGVLRGGLIAPPEPPREGLWTLDWPDASGHYCFDADVGLIVRRAASPGPVPYPAETFEFFAPKSRAPLSLRLPEGRALFLWPDKGLPAEGQQGSYRMVGPSKRAVNVMLSAVPVEDLDPLALARYLNARQCRFALSMFADKADQMDED